MRPSSLFQSLEGWCHSALGSITQLPLFPHGNQVNIVAEDAAKLANNSGPPSAGLHHLNSLCELAVAGLGAFGAVILFIYYVSDHRRTKTRWTADQRNICLVPLMICLVFLFLYRMSR